MTIATLGLEESPVWWPKCSIIFVRNQPTAYLYITFFHLKTYILLTALKEKRKRGKRETRKKGNEERRRGGKM